MSRVSQKACSKGIQRNLDKSKMSFVGFIASSIGGIARRLVD
jgi:hypothetical protein